MAAQAQVHFQQSVTLNLGHFESTRVEVGLTIPYEPSGEREPQIKGDAGITLPSEPNMVDIQKTFEQAVKFVEKNLQVQMDEAANIRIKDES